MVMIIQKNLRTYENTSWKKNLFSLSFRLAAVNEQQMLMRNQIFCFKLQRVIIMNHIIKACKTQCLECGSDPVSRLAERIGSNSHGWREESDPIITAGGKDQGPVHMVIPNRNIRIRIAQKKLCEKIPRMCELLLSYLDSDISNSEISQKRSYE